MNFLTGKKILLGISGGIAAYKTPELIRRLREYGAVVRVIMTNAATNFVTPLTLQTVAGSAVQIALFGEQQTVGIDHIELARWAEVILIAPTTANLMAKLTLGLTDDLLTTVCLASQAPLCLAPAMNHVMWNAPATVNNFNLLMNRGVHFFGPVAGEQVCGEIGTGRMKEPLDLIHDLNNLFAPQLLAGKRILITAGPTREAIDPVRFLSNRSSGKMGYAIAAAAVTFGAQVTLISGPTALVTPHHVKRINVISAQEMCAAVLKQITTCDIFIACAAVADYRPVNIAAQKIKKIQNNSLTLDLEPTEDILNTISQLPQRPFTVGFAAETSDLQLNALDKLQRKKINLVAANWVGDNLGFETDENELQIYWLGGQQNLPRASKTTLACQLLTIIAERLQCSEH